MSSRQTTLRPLGPKKMRRVEELFTGGGCMVTAGTELTAVVFSEIRLITVRSFQTKRFRIRFTGELQPEQRQCEGLGPAARSHNKGSTCLVGRPHAGIADSWSSTCN